MNTQYVRSFTLAFFFFFFFSFSSRFTSLAVTITFTNSCSYTVWPGTLTNGQKPQLSKTGFELASGESKTMDIPSSWSGRFWARTGCSTTSAGNFACETADCGSGQLECNGASSSPPATLIELTVAANGGGQDFYDVSYVDGFNVPMSIAPQGGNGTCKPSSCPANINEMCPNELLLVSSFGSLIGCKSACSAFYDQPQYCCTGRFNSPATCRPTNYSSFFKHQCPDAYSYPYDDQNSAFTCSGAPTYAVTFCPTQSPLLMCIFTVPTIPKFYDCRRRIFTFQWCISFVWDACIFKGLFLPPT